MCACACVRACVETRTPEGEGIYTYRWDAQFVLPVKGARTLIIQIINQNEVVQNVQRTFFLAHVYVCTGLYVSMRISAYLCIFTCVYIQVVKGRITGVVRKKTQVLPAC